MTRKKSGIVSPDGLGWMVSKDTVPALLIVNHGWKALLKRVQSWMELEYSWNLTAEGVEYLLLEWTKKGRTLQEVAVAFPPWDKIDLKGKTVRVSPLEVLRHGPPQGFRIVLAAAHPDKNGMVAPPMVMVEDVHYEPPDLKDIVRTLPKN